jgi:hypothetical protein
VEMKNASEFKAAILEINRKLSMSNSTSPSHSKLLKNLITGLANVVIKLPPVGCG